jgi:acetyl esterase/lipase/pimeloyl-ACP methyl ester carboxylesterase
MKNLANLRKIIAAATFVTLFAFSAFTGTAQSISPVKNIVIVHGAFADASGWEAVYKILTRDGFHVTMVQNPLTSLADDVAATTRALDKQDGPTVLVAHSWGGTVITQAGISPKVASLVYVAAFVPQAGESTAALGQTAPALPKNGILPPDSQGICYFDKALFRECFAAEQTVEKAAFMYDSQQPIVGSCFIAPVTETAWKSKPTYAIVATEDKAINPDLERAMYKRANAVVTELKGSHTIFMSQPEAVAKVIEIAAKAVAVNKTIAIKTQHTNLKKDTMKNESTVQVVDPSQDPQIESHVKAFLQVLNSGKGKPIEELSPKDARAVLTGAQESVQFDYSDITVTEKTITKDGLSINIHIVKPANAKGILPVFMFFHGGGWVLGDFPTHKRIVRDIVIASGAAAVFVDYAPSPEAHYPLAINQAYAATKWVAANGAEIGVNGKNLAVAGNSVGGNMATVVALMAKDKQGPVIKLQVLLWPVTNADFETVSYNQFATGRFLTKKMMEWFWDSYTLDVNQRKEIYASPLQATTAQLKGLPKAFVATAENDVLRDEGEAYARKMDDAGVNVTAIRYNGMIHDWGLLNPIATVPAAQAVLLQAGTEIKKALAN